MSYSPTDPTLDPLRDWFPDWFLTGSQKASREDGRRLVPGFPLSSMGNQSTTPPRPVPTTGSQTPSCRVCGCTDWAACHNTFRQPCYWVEPDLCSQCQPMDGGPGA